jgi:hypothetical protein
LQHVDRQKRSILALFGLVIPQNLGRLDFHDVSR